MCSSHRPTEGADAPTRGITRERFLTLGGCPHCWPHEPDVIDRAISVRSAQAFGDWPPAETVDSERQPAGVRA